MDDNQHCSFPRKRRHRCACRLCHPIFNGFNHERGLAVGQPNDSFCISPGCSGSARQVLFQLLLGAFRLLPCAGCPGCSFKPLGAYADSRSGRPVRPDRDKADQRCQYGTDLYAGCAAKLLVSDHCVSGNLRLLNLSELEAVCYCSGFDPADHLPCCVLK
ncbi:hypothetical protein D3C75_900560 [compost metagenome]